MLDRVEDIRAHLQQVGVELALGDSVPLAAGRTLLQVDVPSVLTGWKDEGVRERVGKLLRGGGRRSGVSKGHLHLLQRRPRPLRCMWGRCSDGG